MPESNALGAGGLGFGQGASFGTTDELSGVWNGLLAGLHRPIMQLGKTAPGRAAIRAALGRPELPDAAVDAIIEQAGSRSTYELSGGPGERPVPGNPDDAYSQAYLRARDEYRGDLDRAQAANPKSYLAGELAGAVMSPGPKAAKGATGLAKAGQLAKAGAAYGAAAGVGYGRAKGLEDPEQLLMEAGAGAGTGAVLTPAAGVASERIAPKLREMSQEAALRAVGLRGGIMSQLGRRGYGSMAEARDLGQAALDLELIRPLRTVEDVAERASFAKSTTGARIENVMADAEAGAAKRADAIRAANEAARASARPGAPTWDQPIPPEFDFADAQRAATNRIQGPDGLTAEAVDRSGPALELVERMGRQGTMKPTFRAANQLKSDMYGGINYKTDVPLSTQLQRQAVRGLRESIESQVENVTDSAVADELRMANSQYGYLADLTDLSREAGNRSLENQTKLWDPLTLSAMASGAAAGASTAGAGGGAMGALGPALVRIAGPRIPSAAAVGLRGLAKPNTSALGTLARPAQQQLSQEEDDAISAFLSGG
jgi:hypothetical protein